MYYFFHKFKIFAIFTAFSYVLFSFWTLATRLFPMLVGSAMQSGTFLQTESLLSACLFSLVPCVLFWFDARACAANARAAMYAGSIAKLMALAAYAISAATIDVNKLLPLIFCLSLGSAILEILTFILIAITLHKNRLEAGFSWAAAAVSVLHHAIYLIELYAGMQLLGNGYVGKWLPILASASTAEFFASIIKGAACALVFLLIYEECKKPNETIPVTESTNTQ